MNDTGDGVANLLGARILIVEDEPAHAEAMQRSLKSAHWTNVEVVETLRDFRTRSVEIPPAIALIDLNLPDGRATELFIHPAAESKFPLIVMTSHSDVKTVIEVMKGGAFDYFIKSQEAFQDLPHNLLRIQREWNLLHEHAEFVNEINAIYEMSLDMICIANMNGYFIQVNPACQSILGYTPEEFCSKPFIEYVHPEDQAATLDEVKSLASGQRTFSFHNRYLTKSGSYCWLEWSATISRNGDRIYCVARDATEKKAAEEKIHQLAFYDALTLLPNRRLLTEHIHHAMTAATRTQEFASVLFIDLDNFKTLNDTQGHNVGDLLLIEVAKRLLNCVREMDTVARLGGDEYVVLLECLSKNGDDAAAQAILVGEKIREELAKPYNLDGLEHYSSASIGISLFRGEEIKLDDLLKHADTAMYQAKESGRNALRFFDPNMQSGLDLR